MKFLLYTFSLLCLLIGSINPVFAQLNEGFEGSFPPTGWTVLDNGVGLTYQWQKSTLNPNSDNAHAYVRYTNLNTALAEDWLVTPKILPDAGDNTLSFYATDDFANDYNSVYTVRVSTTSPSDRGSFDIVATYSESDFTNDVYQQFMVDLSAYDGQEIYVAFVLENSLGDSFFLDDVSGPPVVEASTPPNCDATLTSPEPNASNVPLNASLSWSAATGDPTGYKIQIGLSPGGAEFLALTDAGSATTFDPPVTFRLGTTYYVTIVPYNAAGEAFIGGCSEFQFTTKEDPNIILDCAGAGTPVNRTLCYASSTNEAFTISSNSSNQVNILFNAGTVENNQDEIYIYDGTDATGTLLNPTKLYGNAGDLSGLSYASTTGSLFINLTPDGSNDCQGGDQTTIDFTASCLDCSPPSATAQAGTCDDNNGQFYIDVDFADLGDGTVSVSNDQDATTETVNTIGITTVGPFSFGTVTLTLENTSNGECDVELPAITVNGCALANDECANAIALTLSPDDNCTNAISGNTQFSTASDNAGICTFNNPDVWYSFTPASTDSYVFALSNAAPFTFVAVYGGDCSNGLQLLTENCRNGGRAIVDLVQGQTYLIQVFTDDANFSGSFDLCVQVLPPPPANDLCDNATVITCDGGVLTAQDATYASATGAASCNNETIGSGLWYTISGTGEPISIEVEPAGWDAAIQIWSGADCQNLSCIAQVDAAGTSGAESILDQETTPGTTYYIYVGAFSTFETGGLFDLTVTCSSDIRVSGIVYLQGAYDSGTGLMGDALRTSGNLPLTEPYTDLGYTHIDGGGENVEQAIFDVSGNDAIVDWVFLELRNKTDFSIVITTRSALLQRDGDIVDVDGISPVSFTAPADDYHLAVKHRNHLGVMNAIPVALSNTAITVDFTIDINNVFGSVNGIATLEGGKLGLFSGDFNHNGQIQNTDLAGMVQTLGISGYQPGDFDLNGQVQNTDLQLKLVPNIGRGAAF